ncbi:MAG: 50S ribosomal protein L29 [Candidatus Absconditabacterales bacterium]|nr:50S ribosomal protein L29 [Candidatus Absconditabacterales bacterium]
MKGKGAYIKQLNEKTVKELVSERKKLKKELYNLRMKNAIRGLKNTHKIGEVRINVARVNTVLKSKISKKSGQ